jgi:hypothetical protein
MWEEDPKYQASNCRLLLFGVALATIGVAAWALWEGEWAILGVWLSILGTVFAGLCLYAGLIWCVGHTVQWLAGQRDRRGERGNVHPPGQESL